MRGEQTLLALLRSFFGAIEDWNKLIARSTASELYCDRSSGRSRIGTTVDITSHTDQIDCDRSSGRSRIGTPRSRPGRKPGRLRSFFGAIEDWNIILNCCCVTHPKLRSFFGAIEDWNACRHVGIVIIPNCDRSSGRSRIGTLKFLIL